MLVTNVSDGKQDRHTKSMQPFMIRFWLKCSKGLLWLDLRSKFGEIKKVKDIWFPTITKNIFISSKNDQEKWFQKCLPPLETEKMTIICALSYKHLLCFWCCCDFKKSPLNSRSIVYQMDHIWWDPSRLKMSLPHRELFGVYNTYLW